MLDTVAIKHRLNRPPSEEQLRSMGWYPRYDKRDGTVHAYVHNAQKGSNQPRLTILMSPQMVWYVKVEASLPKMLYGVNIPLIKETEIEDCLRLFSASVEQRSGLKFEANTALVCRADFARDFHIGVRDIVPIIAKISRVQIPRYNRILHNDTSIVFTPKGKSRSKRICIYNKFAEVMQRNGSEEELSSARGILRLEVELRTKAVGYMVGKLELPSREAQYILTQKVADHVLQDIMLKLPFDDSIKPNNDNIIERLITYFSINKAKSLLGFLEMRKQFGEELYRLKELNYPRRTYFSDLSECRKAGILPY